jgi:hypothetical protein
LSTENLKGGGWPIRLFGGWVFQLVCALSAQTALSASLYLAGPGGVFQTDIHGSNQRVLALGGRPELTFTDIAVDENAGTLFYIQTLVQGAQVVVRHDSARPDSIVLFGAGACLAVDEIGRKLLMGFVSGDIQSCDVDGRNRMTAVAGGGRGFSILGIDSRLSNLAWSEYNAATGQSRVWCATTMFGFVGNAHMIFDGPGYVADVSLDVTGGKIYWVDTVNRGVLRANVQGGGVELLVEDTGTLSPTSIAFEANSAQAYFVDVPQAGGQSTVERVNADGTERETLFFIAGVDRLTIGRDGLVGIEAKTWGGVKRLYSK